MTDHNQPQPNRRPAMISYPTLHDVAWYLATIDKYAGRRIHAGYCYESSSYPNGDRSRVQSTHERAASLIRNGYVRHNHMGTIQIVRDPVGGTDDCEMLCAVPSRIDIAGCLPARTEAQDEVTWDIRTDI